MKFRRILAAALATATLASLSCKKDEPLPQPKDPQEEQKPDTPDEPEQPEEPGLPATLNLTTAKWELGTSGVTASTPSWQGSAMTPATHGSDASKAYFTIEAGGSTKPAAVVYDGKICVSNLNTDDAIVFVRPNTTLAAGSTVDFMVTLYAPNANSPKYFIFEYLEDDVWKPVEADLKTATENPSLKYSFYVKYFSSACYTTFIQSFKTSRDIKDNDLKVRCRVVGKYNNGGGSLSPSASAYVGFVKMYYQGAVLNTYQGVPVKDTKKLLVLGNSFTYYYSSAFMLKEIARSQGHELNVRINLKGSQYFRNHSSLELSQLAVKEGGYDFALLQDQSGQHARYYADVKANADVLSETKTLVSQIKSFSPSVSPILENTWAFPGSANYEGYGSYDVFDKALQGGALLIADELDTWMSPIGIAFQKARAAGITDLYHSDNKHPNRNGAYLKSCVNYLLMYGGKFDANVPDCLVPAATAAKLRAIAEEVVSGNEAVYRSPDASKVVPGEGVSAGGGISGGGELDPEEIVKGESGIKTAQQLISFAYLYNTGGDVSSYKNAAGEVALLDDIDLGGALWTPIGGTAQSVALAYNAQPVPSGCFDGVFNGGGHTISNFKLQVHDNATNTMGFFGATKAATVKDVTFKGVEMDFTSSGISSNHICIGTAVGYGYNTRIENVHATAAFTGKATSTASRQVCVGGIVGTLTSGSDFASSIENCSFDGSMSCDVGEKYSNTNTASIAGIIATVTNKGKLVRIKNCTNNAKLDVRTHRAAGIICSGFLACIEGCVNNGDITANYSADECGSVTGVRMGGIMAYCSHTTDQGCYLKNCRNNGTVATSQSGTSAAGGIAGLLKSYVLEGCINTGDIIAPADATKGLLIGVAQSVSSGDVPTISDCYLRGGLSAKLDKSDRVAATADNFLSLGIGSIADGASKFPTWSASNVHFYSGE